MTLVSSDLVLSGQIESIAEDGERRYRRPRSKNEQIMEQCGALFAAFKEQHRAERTTHDLGPGHAASQETLRSAISSFNFARNEIDVLLDLLNNVLDSGNVGTVHGSQAAKRPFPVAEMYKKLRWNDAERRAALASVSEEFSSFAATTREATAKTQAYQRRLLALKHEGWRFKTKLAHGQSQLYVDYGFTTLAGGKIEGLALARPNDAVDGDVELVFPNNHTVLKKISISTEWHLKPGAADAGQAAALNFGSLLDSIQLSLLSMEAFATVRESARQNASEIFNSSESQFGFILAVPSGNVAVLSVRLVDSDDGSEYSSVEIECLRTMLRVLAGDVGVKEFIPLMAGHLDKRCRSGRAGTAG